MEYEGLSVTPMIGVGKNNPLSRNICALLAASRQQITICTPYFNFPLAVTREINRALTRGVKIDIIVGNKTANDFIVRPASLSRSSRHCRICTKPICAASPRPIRRRWTSSN